jgi:pimeloyl-ACP methyl ester carboxylesterase
MTATRPPTPFCEICGSGKTPIVMVHGFGLNRKSWYDVRPLLAEDFLLHLVDLIGFGNSPAPADWPYTIESQADALIRFFQRNHLTDVALAGHSYGGSVALMLMYKWIVSGSDSPVKKLILIAPAAYPQRLPFFISLPRLPFFGALIAKSVSAPFQVRLTLRAVVKNKKSVTQERVGRYVGNLTDPSRRNALVQTAKNILRPEISQLSDRIGELPAPTLLIYGENDSVIPKVNQRRLSRTLSYASVYTIGGCGHIPQEEKPDATAGLISDFLRSPPSW